MKLQSTLLLVTLGVFNTNALSSTGEFGRTLAGNPLDCSDCFDNIDDARDCLRECNSIAADPLDPTGDSLLEVCLDEKKTDSIKELSKCCGFTDKKCEDTLDEVALCLTTCLDGCLVETASAWYSCVDQETGKKGCTRQECLDGFLTDLPDELNVEDNLFDLKNIEKRLKKIKVDDLEDCSLLKEFVDEACRVGDDCCDTCQGELASTLDCLINDIVAPFVAASLNETIPACPIAEDCSTKEFPRRALTQKEADLFNRALRLQSERSEKKEAFLKKVEQQRGRRLEQGAVPTDVIAECQAKMETDIITYNMTEAANNYLACVNAAVFATLEDEPSAGFAATGFKLAALGASLIVAVLV